MKIQFDNSYSRLPAEFYEKLNPTPVAAPKLVYFNSSLAKNLGVDLSADERAHAAEFFSGNRIFAESTPIALAYAGHQYGHFVSQLGDGRAVLLGEIISSSGERFDLQLKGSGPTSFSRRGDGRAALGPMLRELIVGEAMHALNLPTTRTLAVVTTGSSVLRDGIELPGAIQTRVARSHIRVGTFEYFAARNNLMALTQLADYSIQRLFPEITQTNDRYLKFFESIVDRQAQLLAGWMNVGFIHGVMNTDNMAISGETIDYGPCAFMDDYNSKQVYSSIDRHGRYAYENQPVIAQWNLARLAETLLPLFDLNSDKAIALAENALKSYSSLYEKYWLDGMRKKLGLMTMQPNDYQLATDLLEIFQRLKLDFTNTFSSLAYLLVDSKAPTQIDGEWLARWRERVRQDQQSVDDNLRLMKTSNPIYIPRNHRVAEVIHAAEQMGDFSKLEKLMAVLAEPFHFRENVSEYTLPPKPNEVVTQTFCGT